MNICYIWYDDIGGVVRADAMENGGRPSATLG